MADDSGEAYFEDRKGAALDSDEAEAQVASQKSQQKKKSPKPKGKKAAAGSQATKKRKRASTEGGKPKYVRDRSNVLGEEKAKDEEELEFEKALFGDSDIIDRLGGEIPKASDAQADPASLQDKLYEIEGVATTARQRKRRKTEQALAATGPAWVDDDDTNVNIDIGAQARAKKLRKEGGERAITGDEYQKRLREQHGKMSRSNVAWADLTLLEEKKQRKQAAKKRGDDSDMSDAEADEAEENAAAAKEATTYQDAEELMLEALRSTAPLMSRNATGRLEPGKLSIARLRDANFNERTSAVVQSLEFHPNGQIALVAGLDKTLRLFEIDGRQNPHLQSVFFDDMPIWSALFTPDGKEIILSGNKPFFYVYDLVANRVDKVSQIIGVETQRKLKRMLISPDNKYIAFLGDDGQVILLSMQTKLWVANLKMSNKTIFAACFSPDGKYLYVAGKAGEIFVWELESRTCVRRYKDEGALKITCMAISQDGQYQAVGQDSGIVNIYRMSDDSFQTRNPKPMKVITNITTPVAGLRFNHDSQILAIFASDKRNYIKLVHLPSGTVFSNWPKEDLPLKRVTAVAFSPNSSFISVGNVRGHCLLFKLHHFYATAGAASTSS